MSLVPYNEAGNGSRVVCNGGNGQKHVEPVHEKTDSRPGRAYHLGEGFLTDLGERLLPSKNLMADIRPEFLDDVIEGGRFQPCSPVLRCFAQAALLWRVIKVR
jgi:hypothetical protein